MAICRRVAATAERGGIVVGWLVKVTLVLMLIAVVLYDAVSIAYSRVAASDDARYIAMGASEAIVLQRADDEEAIAVARERAESRGVVLRPKDIRLGDDGSVQVHVTRTADTLIAVHIGPLARYTTIDETYATPALR